MAKSMALREAQGMAPKPAKGTKVSTKPVKKQPKKKK